MPRLEQAERKFLLRGATPGLIAGVVFYMVGVLGLYWIGNLTDRNLAPCLWRHATGLPCPLCGGTTASLRLATGRIGEAFLVNPMVTLALPGVGAWLLLRLGFGLRVDWGIPRKAMLGGLVALAFVNWAYVVWSR